MRSEYFKNIVDNSIKDLKEFNKSLRKDKKIALNEFIDFNTKLRSIESNIDKIKKNNEEVEKNLNIALKEKDNLIKQKDKIIEQKDKVIEQKDKTIERKDKIIDDYEKEREEKRKKDKTLSYLLLVSILVLNILSSADKIETLKNFLEFLLEFIQI